MTPLVSILIAIGAFAVGWLGTTVVRRLAPTLGLMQAPNERSSHSIPTPQGGGIAIALVSLAGAVAATTMDNGLWPVLVAAMVSGTLGLFDDVFDLSPALRFPLQGVMLAVLTAWALPLPDIDIPLGLSISGWVFTGIVWLAALWWLNLFNFMDGIDGIAASHAITVLLGGLVVALSVDQTFLQAPTALLALATAAATAGFLVLNWAPARIFMGDAGSNTLAVMILAFAFATIQAELVGYESWLILLSAFITDATVALVRRTRRGERPWRAHRRHAYQQLSRRWGHARVTTLYTSITGLVALPLALLAQQQPDIAWWLVGLVYALLVAFMIRAGSGALAEH